MNTISETIRDRISVLNTKCRPITNCYSFNNFDLANNIWFAGNSFIFSFDDHGVNRLVYFAEKKDTLKELLFLPSGGSFFVEIVTKDKNEYDDIFIGAGYTFRARMMRLVNMDCSVINPDILICNGEFGTLANKDEAHEINELLWSVFQTEVSHLLSDDELSDVIEKGHTRIHRSFDGKIDALLQAEVMPKKFYINQIINLGDKRIIHSILQKELSDYVSNGGKYLYAWVDESNIASLKFHNKYNMNHDGMWSIIYRCER